MRKTYAYNGITIGLLLGLAVGVSTENMMLGILAAIGASVVCFLLIRGLENLMYKGTEKAAEAITRKLDEQLAKKMHKDEE